MSISKKIALGLFAAVVSFSSVSAQAATCTNFTFGAGLYKPFMSAPGVMEVQKFMNANGFTVATTGAGSAGFETSTYGTKTALAVKAFQTAKGVTPTSGFFGNLTRTAALAHQTANCAGTNPGTNPGTGVQTGPVTVALATTNPASAYIVAGQATADLAQFTFTGTGTVNTVKLVRTGISANTTLKNVYLYEGGARLTDAATVNTLGEITFNNVNLMVSGSKTVSVKADIETGTSGQTVGVTLTGYTLTGATAMSTVSVAGNIMSVSGATGIMAGVTVGTNTAVNGATVNPGTTGYVLFSAPVQVSTRAVALKSASFRYIGSATADALANIKLFSNGVQVATASGINAMNYVVFDMMSAPVTLNTGSTTLEVRADIVKGSARTVSLSLQNASDLMVTDSQLGVNVAASGIPTTQATINVNAGTLSVSIDPTFSTMTNVTGGATNTAIAKFKVRAYGEDMKVMRLDVTPVLTGAANNGLNNLAVYFNGAQVGSSFNLGAGLQTGTTQVQLGSSMIVPANTDSTIEIRADLQSAANVNYTSGTAKANIAIVAGQVQGMNSLTTTASATGTANALNIQTGALAVASNPAYVAPVLAPNTAAQKIGSFVLQNNSSSESVRVTNLAVAFTGATTAALTNLANLKTSETSGSGATPVMPQTSNSFSVDFTIAAGTTKTIDVFADVNAALANDVIVVSLLPTALGSSSNVNVTPGAAVTGQTVKINVATLTNTLNVSPNIVTSTSSVSQYVAGGATGATDATQVTYNFKATNGTATITKLKFTGVTSGITSVKVGSVSATVAGGVAYLQGLNIAVPNAGAGVNVNALLTYAPVVVGGGVSSQTALTEKVELTEVEYVAGSTTTTLTTLANAANLVSSTMQLVGSKPTGVAIAPVSGASTAYASGNKQVNVTVGADAKGDILLMGFKTNLTASLNITLPASGTLKENGSAVAGSTVTIAGGVATVSFGAAGYQITAGSSKTFTIEFNVTAAASTGGDSLVATMSTAASALTFKDIAGNGSTTLGTGASDYTKIVGYPTSSVTIMSN